MNKGLLIFCMSLQAIFCAAQEASFGSPGSNVPIVDSVLYNTDLMAVVRDNTKVLLSWRKNSDQASEFIVVERSCGGRDFEVVAVLKQPEKSTELEWVDDAPAKGRNAYRLKYVDEQKQPFYSKPVNVLIAGDISFRFYPNPVDNVLIIRTESPLEIQIADGNGNIRINQTLQKGIQTLNVSGLEKGLYLLRISNKATGLFTQEKLLKN